MVALLGAGAFAVHQLRFLLAFGQGSSGRLAAEGHAYLVPVAPLVVLLLLAAFVQLLASAVRGAAAPAIRVRRLWAGAAAALFAVYCAQELVEGMIASGHPGGLAAILGGGGWLALPLSVAFGLVIALLMRGAAAATAGLAARRPWAPPPPAPLAVPRLREPSRPVSAGLGLISPARGPPPASVLS